MTNDVSPQILLAFLNDAWNRAPESANTLRDTLVADQVAALKFVKLGSLASVGKNSTNQSYKPYGPGSLTHVQIVEAVGNLLSFYDQIKSKVLNEFLASADFDNAEPADFDYDPVCYDLISQSLTRASAGSSYTLPDIRDIRVPIAEETE